MRADVREMTRVAAEAELRENNCYIVLVSRTLIDELRSGWSPPVQLRADSEGGIAELTMRDVVELKP